MTPAEERNLLLKEVLSTLRDTLKPLGFKANGRRFDRARGEDLIDFVSVQTDRYPEPSGLRYRINVETLPLAIWKLHTAGWPKPSIAPNYHFWETTLGQYTKPRVDRWQVVHTLAEARIAANDDIRLLVEFALPFLERVSSSQEVIDGWKRGDYIPLTHFFRDRMIAQWEGKPEPRREDYNIATPAELERDLARIAPLMQEIARKKENFFSRRLKRK